MNQSEINRWDRDANKIIARKRNGVQIADLMGEDADEIDRLRDIDTPMDVLETLLD